jgi:hypothetical protein
LEDKIGDANGCEDGKMIWRLKFWVTTNVKTLIFICKKMDDNFVEIVTKTS